MDSDYTKRVLRLAIVNCHDWSATVPGITHTIVNDLLGPVVLFNLATIVDSLKEPPV